MNECLIDFDESLKDWPQWLRDEVEEAEDDARWASIDRLVEAMRTRVLTEDEETRALRLGERLTAPRSWSYRSSDSQRYYEAKELNDLWFQQRRLQFLAKGVLIEA